MGNQLTRGKLKTLIKDYKVDIVTIVEPMIRDSEILSLSAYLDMLRTLSNGSSGSKLWLLWHQALQVCPICMGEQFYNISIKLNTGMLYGSFVYAK